MKKFQKILMFLVLAVFLMAGSAMATPITPTDWDATVSSLYLKYGPITDDFIATDTTDIGDIENWVYVDNEGSPTKYYYAHKVTPGEDNISEINTEFGVGGFLNIAGYSFSDAKNNVDNSLYAGTGSDLFSIDYEPDGTLDWGTFTDGVDKYWWDNSEAITFFFVSSLPPGMGDYNLINAKTGTAQSYAPVPEPATLLLLGSGLIGLAGIGRKKFRKVKS